MNNKYEKKKLKEYPIDIPIDTKSLILRETQILTIPKTIGDLENLSYLRIDNNLTSIPDTIGNLTKLTELILSNNNLTSIPNTIGKLENLSKLLLSNNKLTSIPVTIVKLENLSSLKLSNNKLDFRVFPILEELISIIKKKNETNLSEEKQDLILSITNNPITFPSDIIDPTMKKKNNEDIVCVSITTHGTILVDDENKNSPILFDVPKKLNSLEIQRACALTATNRYSTILSVQEQFSKAIKDLLLTEITCPKKCSIKDSFVQKCKQIEGDILCDTIPGNISDNYLKKTYSKRYPASKMFSKEIGQKVFSIKNNEYFVKGHGKRDWKVEIYTKDKDNNTIKGPFDITPFLLSDNDVSTFLNNHLDFSLIEFKKRDFDDTSSDNFYDFTLETLIDFLHKTLDYTNIKIFDFTCSTLKKKSIIELNKTRSDFKKEDPKFDYTSPNEIELSKIATKFGKYYGGKSKMLRLTKNRKKNTKKRRNYKKNKKINKTKSCKYKKTRRKM